MLENDLFINGEWLPSLTGARFEIVDPGSGDIIGSGAQADAEDTLAAIRAAESALTAWSATAPWERSRIVRRIGDEIGRRADDIARHLTLEVGKPFAQAKGEVAGAIETFEWFADEARRVFGQVIPGRTSGQQIVTLPQAVGVVGAMTPWNFPVALMARKIAPALAAGCTVVCRPAQEGSTAVALMVECCAAAGVPAGVVNLLTGPPHAISDTIMASETVRKITFTGSTAVGQHLMRKAADTVKRMSMELGGHAPVLVFDDVDIEKTVRLSVTAKMRNSGQVCTSPTRFYVHSSMVEQFTDAFSEQSRSLRMGHGLEPTTEIGPVVSEARCNALEKLTREAVQAGARLVTGGRRPAAPNKGFYFEPTVLAEVPNDASIMGIEPFGPIATINGFDSEDEAISLANSTPYGLGGYVFTGDMRKAQRVASKLRAGTIAVNGFQSALPEGPFGGVGHSGFGRENGTQGILEFLDIKFINYMPE